MYSLFLTLVMMINVQPRVDESKVLGELIIIRQNIEMIETLAKQGVDVDKDMSITNGLLDKAKLASGGKVTNRADLVGMTGGDYAAPTAIERTKGLMTFNNIILFSGVLLAVAAIIWLFGFYFINLIMLVPAQAWHFSLWWACCGSMVYAKQLGDNMLLIAIPGAVGMLGCCCLTYHLFLRGHDSIAIRTLASILAITWGLSAVYLGSHLIGFMAVGAAITALGFIFGAVPGIVWIGFEDDERTVVQATTAGGLMLKLHVLLSMTGNTALSLEVFREGMLWLGAFVFYLGMLIISSKWFNRMSVRNVVGGPEINWTKYIAAQIATIAAGLAALYLGTTYQMTALLGIGGTFFYLYLLEKYYEIPWKGAGWAWSMLGLGVMLYCFAVFARANPNYFLMF